MKYYVSSIACLFAVITVPAVQGSSLRRSNDGTLEFEMDLKDLPQHLRQLNEGTAAASDSDSTMSAREQEIEQIINITSVVGRQYEYEKDSNPSLLNQVIQAFLPLVNGAFQNAIPDPFPIPLRGSFNVPEIDLFGYCKANAGFNLSLGTLTGMSGLSIERIQVFAGTEQVEAGWNINKGCLQTLFSAYFDVEIASDRIFSIRDLSGGIHGSLCSYSFNQSVTGGILTLQPRMRGAINITGEITGTTAKLNLADMRNSLKIGYERIEGYIDNAPQAINDAVSNITSELSVLAKEKILSFIMRDELAKTVSPQVRSISRTSIEGRTKELDTATALQLNTQFMKNQMSEETVTNVESAVTNTLNFFQRIGFTWGGGDGN